MLMMLTVSCFPCLFLFPIAALLANTGEEERRVDGKDKTNPLERQMLVGGRV